MKTFFTLLFAMGLGCAHAQNPYLKRTNHWYFGQYAGLDFSSGTAVADTNGRLNTLEGTAAISDTAGNLLFYYGAGYGYQVFNRNHQVMLNGDSMMPNPGVTPRQAGIVVPKPGSDSIYYLFTVDGWENQWQHGLRYSEIDMSLDGGLGGITSNKNILLKAPVTEQLAAVKHANGCDYWVTTHERYTDKFLAYLVTDIGIDITPVISAIGADYGYMASVYQYNEGLKINFAPEGSFAAIWDFWGWLSGRGRPDTLTLLKFDKWMGLFYDIIPLGVDTSIHCIAISPDSRKLYLQTGRLVENFYQYDVSSWNYTDVVNSKLTILSSSTNINLIFSEDFQNGLDGRIYGTHETRPHLHVMLNPNASGIASNYTPNYLYMGGRQPLAGLPSFIQSFFEQNATLCGVTGYPTTQDISFIRLFPNPATELIEIEADALKEVSIFDLTGRKILYVSSNDGSSTMRMDVSSYARGLYILEIKTKNKHFNHKIILQ